MTGSPPTIGRLRAVTSTAADLDIAEAAWCSAMGYRRVARAAIPGDLAASWGAPAVAGRQMLILQPASGEAVYLRFVEQADPPGFVPMTTIGWGAIELVVQDPAALAARLEGGPFAVLMQPHGVDGYPYLTALQAAGPSGERLNLTRIDPPQPDLAMARSFVDHCFIATLGVPDIEAARAFYAGLGAAVTGVHRVRLSLVNLALGLSRETRHPLAVVSLGGQSKIELDELPHVAAARPRPEGGLPGGAGDRLGRVRRSGCDRAAAAGPGDHARRRTPARRSRGRRGS